MPPHPNSFSAVVAFHTTEATKAEIEKTAADRGMSVAALMRECWALRRRFSTFDALDIIDRMQDV
jgi:hypothetical protein